MGRRRFATLRPMLPSERGAFVFFIVTNPLKLRLIYRTTGKEVVKTDKDLTEKLYEAYYMKVYSFLMARAGNRDLAEELTQETFFRAFTTEHLPSGQASPFTWLCTIAKNLLTDHYRKSRHESGEELPEEAEAPGKSIEEAVSDRDLSLRIHRELHRLEEPYREVFELRVFGELSFQEIGTIFGKTESWARVTYHQAGLKLRERMEKHEI